MALHGVLFEPNLSGAIPTNRSVSVSLCGQMNAPIAAATRSQMLTMVAPELEGYSLTLDPVLGPPCGSGFRLPLLFFAFANEYHLPSRSLSGMVPPWACSWMNASTSLLMSLRPSSC